MQKNLIIIYLLVFLSAIILLRMVGIIHIENSELIGYALIVYGLSLFYSSFIQRKKSFLFVGSCLFLFGVVLFIIANFEFTDTNSLILPSAVFILCISSFMVYLSDAKQKLMLYVSVILLAAGIGVTALIGTQGLPGFFENVISVTTKYWVIIVILVIVIVLVSKDSNENNEEG